jgi:hypothetical protein
MIGLAAIGLVGSSSSTSTTTTAPTTTSTTTTEPTTTSTTPTVPGAVTAIGDSVMLEAVPALHAHIPNLYADATVARQFGSAVPLVAHLAASGQLGDDIIIHLGTNGRIIGDDIKAIMAAATPARKVIFVNVKANRPWESSDNNTLRTVTAQYPNAFLVDWHSYGDSHSSMFWSDGIHLKPQFIDTYASLIAAAVR